MDRLVKNSLNPYVSALLLVVGTPLAFAEEQIVVVGERPDQVIEAVKMNSVVFVDHVLNRKKGRDRVINISVDSTGMSRTPGGYREAWAVFRNHTDHEYLIEVRAQFFDMNQVMTNDSSKWKRVFVPANSLQKYAESSIDLTSTYYRLEVRSVQ